MSYISYAQYCDITHTHDPGELENADVYAAIGAAETAVDAATLYGYVGRDPDALPAYIADRLREAVAYQAQYILQQGGADAFNSGDGELGSVSLGKFSYGRGSGGSGSGSGSAGGDLQLSPLARANIPLLRAYARTLRKEGLT